METLSFLKGKGELLPGNKRPTDFKIISSSESNVKLAKLAGKQGFGSDNTEYYFQLAKLAGKQGCGVKSYRLGVRKKL